MLKVIVLATGSAEIEKLPDASVSPPFGLFLKVMLTFCSGERVTESITKPVMVLVWAAINPGKATTKNNMIFFLQISIDFQY